MPALPLIRLGDTSDHGGEIITASPTVLVDSLAVARLGDILDCPLHGPSPIITASATVSADGIFVARAGDTTDCGATLLVGSPDVSAG